MIKILNQAQIERKIKRLSVEILERNLDAPQIVLAGINRSGYAFAALLAAEIKERTPKNVILTRIRLNPAAPTASAIDLELPTHQIDGQHVVVVDDVANTGRTLFFALQPMLNVLPKKVEIAVLADRKHKTFPIRPDYVGLEIATTLREHIDVQLHEPNEWAVFLR